MDPNSHDRSAGEAGNSLRASIHAKPDYEYVARQHSDRAAAKFPRGERLWRALDGRSFHAGGITRDRKSTRLNSSHGYISYAVFCLKKKKKNTYHRSIAGDHTLCVSSVMHPVYD